MVHICLNCLFLPTLKVVDLEGDFIGDNAGCLFVTLLAQYARNLETLILKDTGIHMHTIAALYLMLEGKEFPIKDRPLKEISIANNKIDQSELCKLLIAVSECPTLQKLDLSGLNLSEGCAKLVSTIIRYDKKLAELDISHNKMSSESHRIMFTALARNRKLKKLRICDMGVDDESLKVLKLGLIYNNGMKEIALDYNKITEAGLSEIKEIIIGNKKIEIISLDGNPIKSLKLLRDDKEEIEKTIKCELRIGTKHAYLEYVKRDV